MIEIKKYMDGDIDRTEWRDKSGHHLNEFFCNNPSESIFWDDEIIAIMGMATIWDGLAQVAMAVSDKVLSHKKAFYVAVAKALKAGAKDLCIRKVYTVVDVNSDRDIKWIESLGFTKEYVMVEAGPLRQDMLGYSKNFHVVGTDYMKKEK